MKKIISVLLVVSMLFAMSIGASAAIVTTGIKQIHEQNFQDAMESAAASGLVTIDGVSAISSMNDLADLEVNPGDELRITLPACAFLDSSGTPVGSLTDTVSLSALRTARITMKATSSSSNVANISLKANRNSAYISVEFNGTPTINKARFNYSIYLYANGSRKSTTRMQVKGIMEPEIIEVDSYDDNYVDISDGQVVKPITNVRKFELYLGEYVTITRDLTRNVKYCGKALTDVLSSDDYMFERYPALEQIYRLQTVNLKTTGNIVNFDLDDTFYVYSSFGNYLGTSDKALPYYTKYYLTDKKYASLTVK